QCDRFGGNRLAPPDLAELLHGLRFHAYLIDMQHERCSDLLPHVVVESRQLRLFADDRRIDVRHHKAVPFKQLPYFAQEADALGSGIRLLRLRKMHSDVSQSRCSQKSINDRMQERVTVRVTHEPFIVRNDHSTKDEISPLDQAVDIEAVPDSHLPTSPERW